MLSVIIPIGGNDAVRREYFAETLRCLDNQSSGNWEFILVEQSIDGNFYYRDILSKNVHYHYVSIEHPDFNMCWCYNVGVRVASGGRILCTVADLVFGDDYLELLASVSNIEYAIPWDKLVMLNEAGRDLYFKDGYTSEGWDKETGSILTSRVLGGSCGMAWLFNKDFFLNELGGWNENFKLWGGQDRDIIWRAFSLTKKAVSLFYTILHLPHSGRIVGPRELWYITQEYPHIVNEAVKRNGVGRFEAPTYFNMLELVNDGC